MTDPPTLGELIRRQREFAELPMRQLAAMVGISNPYLSQIENGLRAPSEQVLGNIADSLQISADLLRAANSGRDDAAAGPVIEAIGSDPDLSASQRRALVEAYTAFREVTVRRRRSKPNRTRRENA